MPCTYMERMMHIKEFPVPDIPDFKWRVTWWPVSHSSDRQFDTREEADAWARSLIEDGHEYVTMHAVRQFKELAASYWPSAPTEETWYSTVAEPKNSPTALCAHPNGPVVR